MASNSCQTDWELCALCQEVKTETLQCPADSRRHDLGAGYETLAENILQFEKIGSLPLALDLSRLDEGGGICNTFKNRKARWHKSCYSHYNSTKLKRAEKRKTWPADTSARGRQYTR